MDVRESNIVALLKRARDKNYQQYLSEIRLTNVRAFRGSKVTLDFSVTAVIGTNGGGKSTILGAAAIAYKSVKPGDFFPKSNELSFKYYSTAMSMYTRYSGKN